MAKRRKAAKVYKDGTDVEYAVKSAHLGWGRLETPDLGAAAVLEVLRIRLPNSLLFEQIREQVRLLSVVYRFPLFDPTSWEMQVRLEFLVEEGLIDLQDDQYTLSDKTYHLFGDSNLTPKRGPRKVIEPHQHRLGIPTSQSDE
jgi:hypothetical protein